VLRISAQPEKDQILLRIEGKLIDPWTKELEAMWQDLAKTLAGRKLFLDIRAATFIDQGGVEVLRKIVRLSNAILLADSPLTRQFARNIRQSGTDHERK
jgi:anti-anti-sigma regulatory factor